LIQVALFGAGRIGKIHAGNLAIQPGVQLRYVVDVSAATAAEVAQRYAAEAVDADTALKDSAISAVLIASSTDTHADLITRAAAAGKAIFCEKPVDLALERARACVEAVSKARVLCMIGFQRRFDPTFSALKRRLDAGEIGDPEMLIITSRDPGPPPVSYVKVSGGVFKDMLIHDFDVFRWVLEDEAQSIFATGSCLIDAGIGEAGDVDSTVVSMRTRGGRLCQINTSRRASYGYDQRFEVLGSKGLLQARNHPPTQVVAQSAGGVCEDKPEHFFLERYRVAYALEIDHFFDALTKGKPVRTTLQDGVKALELAEAAARSWREGHLVTL
jgi:myo-inositol 2-dehydrogenase / D-chiro-inositol 1-dehydrogenase